MLLTVEGGGFFSSSASGYSKGLTLLLFGQKEDERPMRVAPWNQYQFVDQEAYPESDLHLASLKNQLSQRGCASFVCFGRTSTGCESPSILKVGPAQHQDIVLESLVSDRSKEHTSEVESGKEAKTLSLRSSLKRPSIAVSVPLEDIKEQETVNANCSNIPGNMERRKVQWTDAHGSELTEVREFEPSEMGVSDDEFETGRKRTCSCVVM